MKMRMRNLNVFWSILMLTLMIPSMALAQGSGEDPHRRLREGAQVERPQGHPPVGASKGMRSGGINPFSAEGLSQKLNLNEQQTQKMQDLLMDYRKGIIQKRAALEVAMIDLEEAIARPKLDMGAIEKQAKQKEAAATDLTLFRVRELAKAKEFLSDAQFDQFRSMIEMRMTSGSYPGFRGGSPHGGMGMMGGHGMMGMSGRHGMGMRGEHGMGMDRGGSEESGSESYSEGYDE
ncbi:MAG TPA: periplasmic heavy metal sensor [Candidatus Manganitrophaceae bacterium]|nr:periplasmic heavy metal sensor [Candidatus Manganitrophaceae bacterium]